MLIPLGLLLCVALTNANPVYGRGNEYESAKVLYDQKQEGGWNIRADLKNFLFVIIPTTRSAPTNSSALSSSALEEGLLYLLSKSANAQKHHHHKQTSTEKDEDEATSSEETKHFIESKSAPYQVDISRTPGGLLSKLYPEKTENEGVLVARSPTISLLKDPVTGRMGRALVISVPSEDVVITKSKRFRKKARDEVAEKRDVNLRCQPGQVRDSYGKCKVFKY